MVRPVIIHRYESVVGVVLLVLASTSYAQNNLPAAASNAAAAAASHAPPFQNSSVKAPALPAGSEKVVLSPGVSPGEKNRSANGHSGKLSNKKLPVKLPPQTDSTTEE